MGDMWDVFDAILIVYKLGRNAITSTRPKSTCPTTSSLAKKTNYANPGSAYHAASHSRLPMVWDSAILSMLVFSSALGSNHEALSGKA